MTGQQLHLIQSKAWQIGILPGTGASVAFGKIYHDGKWLDFMRPTDEANYDNTSACASYVLIPWSNRVKGGHFRYEGKEYDLRVNAEDGTAIHGTAKDFAWKVELSEPTRIVLSFNSDDRHDVNFPWKFCATVEYRVEDNNFVVETELKNKDKVSFPGGLGHHPYFMRTLTSQRDTAQLEIPCPKYFFAPDRIPTAAPIPVEPRVDFQQLRDLGDVLVDDCLTGRTGKQSAHIVYTESRKEFALHFDALYQNIVVYIPPGKPFFAVEPVTNANDGFNLYDKKIPGSGVFVLSPGESKKAVFTLEVVR